MIKFGTLSMAVSSMVMISFLTVGVSAFGETPFVEYSLVRQKCAACHQPDQQGRLEVLEETRKTPEEWKVVVDRMIRLNDAAIEDSEFHSVVKEVSKYLCLSPGEMAEVAYINSDENSQYREIPKTDLEKRIYTACVRCHTFAKIASHRMTRNQWIENRNLHLGYVPTVVGQMREMDWPKESLELVEPLSELYPNEDPEWTAWMKSRKEQDLTGEWKVSGYQPGLGYYEGTYTFKPNSDKGEDEYLIEEEIRYENGEGVKLSGEGTLYSEYHLRYSLSKDSPSEVIEGVFDLDADAMGFKGKWWKVLQDTNMYGDEEFHKVGGDPNVFALFPKALSTATKGKQKLTLIGIGLPDGITASDIKWSDPNTKVEKVERIDATKLVCTITVNKKTSLGTVTLSVEGASCNEHLTVYDKIDGIKVFPALGRARVSCGPAYPPQGVQFVARSVHFGPDGNPDTADDIVLEPVNATWWLEEEKTRENDDDLKYLETSIANGCYTPITTYAPIEERHQRREGVGLIAVGARYSDGGRELKGRSLLAVTEPDFVTHLK
jgi:quinohemoprotein amine dehydrogenase alpha subunit